MGYENGKKCVIIDALNKRQRLLSKFIIPFYCTDDYRVYSANLPREKHIIGKRKGLNEPISP